MNAIDFPELTTTGLRALVQILIVTAGVYLILLRVARPRAFRILTGLLLLIAFYLIAWAAQLQVITFVLEILFGYGAIAALVIFQPELRSGLARLGRTRLVHDLEHLPESELVSEIAEAVERLARANIGAIIVVEMDVGLDEYVATGTRLEARVGADLLVSIFSPYGPLHDGAVLISGDTVFAAGVILPLTQFPVADRALGTRHRAAIGISEETDALAIVVSEESSQISLAMRGRMERDVDGERLRLAIAAAVAEHEA
ncbi:MAG TPA: diadenylate cyclase CdaA [Longimicrobiales bacterium]|nr:diadenylate cyclase CdaA [Longimicrobiales bacterium]